VAPAAHIELRGRRTGGGKTEIARIHAGVAPVNVGSATGEKGRAARKKFGIRQMTKGIKKARRGACVLAGIFPYRSDGKEKVGKKRKGRMQAAPKNGQKQT